MEWDQGKLSHIWQQRQQKPAGRWLGQSVDKFLRQVIIPRQKKLSKLGQAWKELLPPELAEHSCLEGLRAGQLRVLVDSAAHLSELNLLLREGLLDELRQMCPQVSLSRIKLVRGQWYDTDEEGTKIPRFGR